MPRSVRELQAGEVYHVVDYFRAMDLAVLDKLGVDPSKVPERDDWIRMVSDDFGNPDPVRKHFYVAWLLDNQPVGHSNINDIQFGEQAFMHLHIWQPDRRYSGHAQHFLRESVRIYFDRFQLKRVYCQPKAENTAPQRALAKAGFSFVKTYHGTPGWLNVPQNISRWVIEPEQLEN
jgi:RimJ/RimL family protein N-acetyltransferase